MHPSDQNRQSENLDTTSGNDMPYIEPTWLKPVKTAVKIMSLLIVIGIGLLFYGLATQVGGLSQSSNKIAKIHFPETFSLTGLVGAGDGSTIMAFQGSDGAITVIQLSADHETLQVIANLIPDASNVFTLETE